MTYVAQENIVLDTPAQPLQHPLVSEMFDSFVQSEGRFEPSARLRREYPRASSATPLAKPEAQRLVE